MTQIDWSKARKGFDFHFKGKSGADTGDFYFISPLNDRFVSETGSYILFRDMKDLPELFEISMRPDDSSWTCEGLPPVGIDVEIHNKSGRRVVEGAESFIGSTCKVMATFVNMNGYEMVSVEDSGGSCMCFRADMCGPIRTPAQLAAEEREKAIEEMTESSLYGHYAFTKAQAKIACGVLYDVGYRKVEVKP